MLALDDFRFADLTILISVISALVVVVRRFTHLETKMDTHSEHLHEGRALMEKHGEQIANIDKRLVVVEATAKCGKPARA